MKVATTILFLVGIIPFAVGQKTIRLASPDGDVAFSFSLSNSVPSYSVAYKTKPVLQNSLLSPSADGKPIQDIRQGKASYRKGVESYELITGKNKKVSDPFNEVIIPLEDSKKETRLNLHVRAFNNGLGFRYEYVQIKGQDSLILTDERTTFQFVREPLVRALPLPN